MTLVRRVPGLGGAAPVTPGSRAYIFLLAAMKFTLAERSDSTRGQRRH
jgi:hypothetical protein